VGSTGAWTGPTARDQEKDPRPFVAIGCAIEHLRKEPRDSSLRDSAGGLKPQELYQPNCSSPLVGSLETETLSMEG
jgi:hypothetical protein